MKTPISYYGGKQRLVPEILPLIPKHTQYVEPFCGGAAVFWAKDKSAREVLNDYDLRVVNFWEVLQADYDGLAAKICSTLHSEHQYKRSAAILKAGRVDALEFAWAFWVQVNMSFSNKLMGGFAHGGNQMDIGSFAKILVSNKRKLLSALSERLEGCEIFCRDAVKLIQQKDGPDTFFYFDPPYKGSECGHYEGKQEVFDRLLELLPTLQGKWLMSSYPDERLTALRLEHGWKSDDLDRNLSVSGKHNAGKRKTECLTYNYTLADEPIGLFAAQHLAY